MNIIKPGCVTSLAVCFLAGCGKPPAYPSRVSMQDAVPSERQRNALPTPEPTVEPAATATVPPVATPSATATPTATPSPGPTEACGTDAEFCIRKTSTAPAIDGVEDAAWQGVGAAAIAKLGKGQPPADAADLEASFRLMYDETALYVLAIVRDDQTFTDSQWQWEDDSLELYLDLEHDRATSYLADDFQFIFRAVSQDFRETYHGGNGFPGLAAVVQNRPDGVTYEIAVPWATLSFAPTSGRKIGFSIGLNDDDDGAERETQLIWNVASDLLWSNPSLFGTASLQ